MPEPQPDPSKIGVVPQPPLAVLPDPAGLFARRVQRLRFLAQSSPLAPYLHFLAGISDAQGRLTRDLPQPPAASEEQVALAREHGLPPIDRDAVALDAGLTDALEALLAATAGLPMPAEAAASHASVRGADREGRLRLLANILAGEVEGDEAGLHLWAGAAVQLHFTRLAAALDAARLAPVATGVCPCCGGAPAVSVVTALARLEGIRYAVCATCATMWNEVRVKCLACGSTKGITYRGLGDDPVIKAEVCAECDRWVKVLYQLRDPALDPMADDVGSVGLNLRMTETGVARASFSPYLIGF